MATTPLYGTDASLTTTSFGCHWNAFTFDVAQGTTGYFGFSDQWMTNHGTIASWSGSLAGFTTHGTANDVPGSAILLTRAGVSQTFTWATSITMAGTIILTNLGMAVQFLGTDTSAYAFVGTGAPTEAAGWAT
jgi:hypothetical protein